MTPEQKAAIVYLREQGLGYKAIGVKLSLSSHTIKSFCRREAIKTGEKTDEMLPDYCHAYGRILIVLLVVIYRKHVREGFSSLFHGF